MDEQRTELLLQDLFCLWRGEFREDKIAEEVLVDREKEVEENLLPILSQFACMLETFFLERHHANRADKVGDVWHLVDQCRDLLPDFWYVEIFEEEEKLDFLAFNQRFLGQDILKARF